MVSESASQVFTKASAALDPLEIWIPDLKGKGVLALDRQGQILWHCGYQSDLSLERPVFVQGNASQVLITDARRHQVLLLKREDQQISHCLEGSGGLPFKMPQSAVFLKNGHILISDMLNRRLVEVNLDGEEIWTFRDETLVVSPQYAEELDNGDILFTDDVYNRVVQLKRSGEVVWYYGSPLPGELTSKLLTPQFATRLANGHTLICDTRHHRVVEVNAKGDLVWFFNGRARHGQLNPTWAKRLENGNTLIVFGHHHLVIEVDSAKECLWSYTMGQKPFEPPQYFSAADQLSWPGSLHAEYDAELKAKLAQAQREQEKILELQITLMPGCQMKSLRAAMIMMSVEKLATLHGTFPKSEDLMAECFDQELILVVGLKPGQKQQVLHDAVSNIAEVLAVELEQPHLS